MNRQIQGFLSHDIKLLAKPKKAARKVHSIIGLNKMLIEKFDDFSGFVKAIQ